MKFTMKASDAPFVADRWFSTFSQGKEFEAESEEAAQNYLDEQL